VVASKHLRGDAYGWASSFYFYIEVIMDRIPNCIDHRRNFEAREKAGLVATNPTDGLAPPACPVPGANAEGLKTLAAQLGLPIQKQEEKEETGVPEATTQEIVVDPDTPNTQKLNIPTSTEPPVGGTLPHPGDSTAKTKSNIITIDPFAI